MDTYQITETKNCAPVFELPEPRMSGGMPLMDALQRRRSHREFLGGRISDQQLSELLWAAYGINKRIEFRGKMGMRTVPTAKNHQEVEVYVFLPSGIYLYDALENTIKLVCEGDHRASAGNQAFFSEAALSLCLVSDFSKMDTYTEDKKAFYSGIDVGYVSQNIYMYCASEGLATVACGSIDRDLLHKLLMLKDARAMLSHPVGGLEIS